MIGYVSSIETMGLVDGPGIRFVVFMQGCKLRCLFCHNPETWCISKENKIFETELLNKILKYKNYFGKDGGVTFSGGDPLIQSEFLLRMLKLCKENSIHTCLDTAGVGGNINDQILDYVDLVIMDIKAIDEEKYKYLTGREIHESIEFLKLCDKKKKKIWIRQVLVPGFNDTEEYILKLSEFLSKYNIEKVEFLPYSILGNLKYKELNIPYKLKDIPPMDKARCDYLLNYYNEITKTKK